MLWNRLQFAGKNEIRERERDRVPWRKRRERRGLEEERRRREEKRRENEDVYSCLLRKVAKRSLSWSIMANQSAILEFLQFLAIGPYLSLNFAIFFWRPKPFFSKDRNSMYHAWITSFPWGKKKKAQKLPWFLNKKEPKLPKNCKICSKISSVGQKGLN